MRLAELQAYCQGISQEVKKELERDLRRALTPVEETIVYQTLAKTAKVVANRLTNAAATKFLKDLT